MFDIGWSEMLVVGVVALVVIGPKELPAALRTAGRMVGKARGIASEFRQHWDDAMREAELDEIRKKAEEATGIGDVKSTVENLIDPKNEIADAAKVAEPAPSIEAPPPATAAAETASTPPAPAPETTPPRT